MFQAGHLFEDPSMRGHFDIKSHLEDLANRHPEFADQLHYPAWSNDNRSNTWGRKRRGSGQPESGEATKQQPQESTEPQPAQEPTESDEPTPLRSRQREDLRNTVPDMGQKQQEGEQDSRGQRSWSAPPDNRTQQQEKPRFVSKIEITPVNPDAPQQQTGDAQKPPMAPPKPQPQQQPQPQAQSQPKSNVRHIPIFVEGRDEPVLPKNIEPEVFTQTQAPQSFTRPPPQPFQYNQFQQQPPQRKQQTPPQYEQHPPPQQRQQPPQQRQQPPQQQQKPEPTPPAPQEQQPEPPKVNVNDPLYRVSLVQKEVDELKAQVDSFKGTSRSDKQYILLDEFLTRELIKLDNIETEGKEEVRAARKNAIKSIQEAISVLENKIPAPESNNSEEVMDVEQQASAASEAGDSASNTQPNVTSENIESQPVQETSTQETASAEEKPTESSQQPVSNNSTENKTA